MITVLGYCQGDACAASRDFALKFPGRRVPDTVHAYEIMLNICSVPISRPTRHPEEHVSIGFLAAVEFDPTASTKRNGRETDGYISRSKIIAFAFHFVWHFRFDWARCEVRGSGLSTSKTALNPRFSRFEKHETFSIRPMCLKKKCASFFRYPGRFSVLPLPMSFHAGLTSGGTSWLAHAGSVLRTVMRVAVASAVHYRLRWSAF